MRTLQTIILFVLCPNLILGICADYSELNPHANLPDDPGAALARTEHLDDALQVVRRETDKKTNSAFRNYTNAPPHVKELYRLMHLEQTYEGAKAKRAAYANSTYGLKMSIMETAEIVGRIVDKSDPDNIDPQIVHAYQTAMGLWKAKKPDWMVMAGFMHDLGKILASYGEPQHWVVGDTFVLGMPPAKSVVLRELGFKNSPDHSNQQFQKNPLGIYHEGVGLDNTMHSFGHDWYLHHVISRSKHKLPDEALAIFLYHSMYPWHRGDAYRELMNAKDRRVLKTVQDFQKFDLYTKAEDPLTPTEAHEKYKNLRKFLEDTIEKYFPEENGAPQKLWWPTLESITKEDLERQGKTKEWSVFGSSDILMRHRVNDQERLKSFLSSPAEIAEGDVLVGANGSIIMGHPPQTTSDLTFRDWITGIHQARKKAKIDIKDARAIPEIITILKDLRMEDNRLILNADIVEAGRKPSLDVFDMQRLRREFPDAIISIGLALDMDNPPDPRLFHKKILKLRRVGIHLGGTIQFTLPEVLVTPKTIDTLSATLEGRSLSLWNTTRDRLDPSRVEALSRMAPHSNVDLYVGDFVPIQRRKPWDGKNKEEVRARTIKMNELYQWIENVPSKEVLLARGVAPIIVADLDGTLWRAGTGLSPLIIALAREKKMLTRQPRNRMDQLLEQLGLEPQHSQGKDNGVGRDFLRAWNYFPEWSKNHTSSKVTKMNHEMEAMYGWVLAGISVKDIHRLVDEVVETQNVIGRVFQGMPEVIARARADGIKFAVVTTTPEVIAQRFNEIVFGIPHKDTKGTRIRIDYTKNSAGVMTTEVLRVAHHEGKADGVEEILRETPSVPSGVHKVFLTILDNPHGGDSHLTPLGERALVVEPSEGAVTAGLKAKNVSFLSVEKTQGGMAAGEFSHALR